MGSTPVTAAFQRRLRFVAPERLPSSLKGRIELAEDLDEPLPDDVLVAFAGAGG